MILARAIFFLFAFFATLSSVRASSADDEVLDKAFALGVLSAKHISNINRASNLQDERDVPLPVAANNQELEMLREILTRVTQMEAQFRPAKMNDLWLGTSVGELTAVGTTALTAALFLWLQHRIVPGDQTALILFGGIADVVLGIVSAVGIYSSIDKRFEGLVFGHKISIPGEFFERILSPVRSVQSRLRRGAFAKRFREGFLSVAIPEKLLDVSKKYNRIGPRGLVAAAINSNDCTKLLAEISSR